MNSKLQGSTLPHTLNLQSTRHTQAQFKLKSPCETDYSGTTIEPADAAEVAGKLLEADDQRQFVARITPVILRSVKVFIEKPVVHSQLKGRYQSKVLVRYRVFNTGEEDVVLPAPGVRLQLDGQWINCTPTSAAAITIPAGGYDPGPSACTSQRPPPLPVRRPTCRPRSYWEASANMSPVRSTP
jgi:hypothetical protein